MRNVEGSRLRCGHICWFRDPGPTLLSLGHLLRDIPRGPIDAGFRGRIVCAPVDRTLLHAFTGTIRYSDEDTTMEFNALVERARGEFLEMPGLQLTVGQAARLWGLDFVACQRVIATLVGAEFLRWTRDGKVALADPWQLL